VEEHTATLQTATVQHEWCRDNSDRDRGWACEVREFSLSPGELRNVDASPNGGISVTGWERNEISVLARVQGQARTDDIARELLNEVRIAASGATLEARGPGVSIEDVSGALDFSTTNGGVTLIGVGGDVRGRTTNGGLKIQLQGDSWEGQGLDVRTTNGGVKLGIPEGYSAMLESGLPDHRERPNRPPASNGVGAGGCVDQGHDDQRRRVDQA
jgi:hypothetical protein